MSCRQQAAYIDALHRQMGLQLWEGATVGRKLTPRISSQMCRQDPSPFCHIMSGMRLLQEVLLRRQSKHSSRTASWCQLHTCRCLLSVPRGDSVSIRSAKQ